VPTIPGVELAACIEYCDATGGDYYDFIQIERDAGQTETLLVIGDVTGHGIAAALLMATARGVVRTAARTEKTLGDILTCANRALAGSENGMFMTMSIVSIDVASRTIRWASAGHDPTIVYHPERGTFDELHAMDYPLGVEPDVEYRELTCNSARPGAILLIGTDGIWEARNEQGEMFGKDRLRELIRGNASSAEQLATAIRRAMEQHVGNRPLADDVTFIIAKVTD
jgi:sigma-B regulation protein RsbU (phosphoserine phosphatase)